MYAEVSIILMKNVGYKLEKRHINMYRMKNLFLFVFHLQLYILMSLKYSTWSNNNFSKSKNT